MRHELPVFRDGTVRYDMSDVPITHFRPREIGVPWKKLHGLGYTHDHRGRPLEDDEQTLELFPQDFIVAKGAADFLLRTANYIDELLVRFYKMEPYYNADKADDLIGHLICAARPAHERRCSLPNHRLGRLFWRLRPSPVSRSKAPKLRRR